MTHLQVAVPPEGFGEAGFFAAFGRVAQEDLAGDGKYCFIGKAIEQRPQKVRFHPHVAVEQDHNIVLRCPETSVRPAAEAEVFRQCDQLHLRVVTTYPLCAAIGGTVIDQHYFAARMMPDRRHPRGQKALQQVTPVPVGDDERRSSHRWHGIRRAPAPPQQQPQQICRKQGGAGQKNRDCGSGERG